MALRLSKFFDNSYKFWLNLQNELEVQEIKMKKEKELSELGKINSPIICLSLISVSRSVMGKSD
jgi:plasmid maintenance system antidote protein VapI